MTGCLLHFSCVFELKSLKKAFLIKYGEGIHSYWQEFRVEEIIESFTSCSVPVQPYRALTPAHHPGIIVLSEKPTKKLKAQFCYNPFVGLFVPLCHQNGLRKNNSSSGKQGEGLRNTRQDKNKFGKSMTNGGRVLKSIWGIYSPLKLGSNGC